MAGRARTLYYESVSDFTIACRGHDKSKLTVCPRCASKSPFPAKRGQSCSFEEYPFLESVVPADAGLPARPCQVQIVGRTAFIPRLFRYGDNVLAYL